MNKDDLRFVADALLALCEADQDRPFLTEDAFETKLKRSRLKSLRCPLETWLSDDLGFRECEDVLERACLTERQLEVFRLRFSGCTFDEIGHRGRCTKQGAQRVFLQALKKLHRSRRVYRYEGLADVYRCETRRGLRPKPLR